MRELSKFACTLVCGGILGVVGVYIWAVWYFSRGRL